MLVFHWVILVVIAIISLAVAIGLTIQALRGITLDAFDKVCGLLSVIVLFDMCIRICDTFPFIIILRLQ